MPEHRFIPFDVTVRPSPATGPSQPYPATVAYRGRTAEGIVTQDIHAPFWQVAVNQLADPTQRPGSQRLMEMGQILFDDLMQGAVRDLWISARGDLDSGLAAGIRLRLALLPPAVACLPWEALYDRDRNEPFAASAQTPLVRVENLFRHVGASRPLRTTLPIKILAVAPTDPTGQIDATRELEEIQRIVAAVGSRHFQVVSQIGQFDIVELRRTIEVEQPDILHLIGHGQPEGILLWKQGQPSWTPASSLRVILQRATSVKLVVLNVCLAGRVSDRTPFSTVGPQLLQTGIPAVVAMQFEVLAQNGADFTRYLYEELIAGPIPGAIDAAVGYARSNLYALEPDSFGFGAPVLWLNAEDGVIFAVAENKEAPERQGVSAMSAVEAGPTSEQARRVSPMPERPIDLRQLQQQDGEIAQWLAAQRDIPDAALDAALRHIISVRNDELQNVQDQFRQLRSFKSEQLRTANVERAILEQYQSRLTRIMQKKERIESMNRMIHQQLSKQ